MDQGCLSEVRASSPCIPVISLVEFNLATVYRKKAFLWLLSFCFYEKKVTRCCEQLPEESLQPIKHRNNHTQIYDQTLNQVETPKK